MLKQTLTTSNNGLAPGRHQAIGWTNADPLLIKNRGQISVQFESYCNNFDNEFENIVCNTGALLSRPRYEKSPLGQHYQMTCYRSYLVINCLSHRMSHTWQCLIFNLRMRINFINVEVVLSIFFNQTNKNTKHSLDSLYQQSINRVDLGTPISNFICMLFLAMDRSLLIFNDVTSKMAAWRSYCFYSFRTLTLVLLWISTPNFGNTLPVCMGRGLFIVGDVTSKKTTRVALFLVSEANFIWALHINS